MASFSINPVTPYRPPNPVAALPARPAPNGFTTPATPRAGVFSPFEPAPQLYTPARAAGSLTAAPLSDPAQEQRWDDYLWGLIQVDRGPSTDALGCGAVGTTGVPDHIRIPDLGIDLNLRPACDTHDANSAPLAERNPNSFWDVLGTQFEFARDIYNGAGPGLVNKLFGGAVAGIYSAATGVVGLGHWGVSRLADGWDALGSAASGLWDSITSLF